MIEFISALVAVLGQWPTTFLLVGLAWAVVFAVKRDA